eukprot:10343613-Alexandrium_andersonii.AAC.1
MPHKSTSGRCGGAELPSAFVLASSKAKEVLCLRGELASSHPSAGLASSPPLQTHDQPRMNGVQQK